MAAAAIDALPATQGDVVRLRDVEGWDPAEVCAALDLSPGCCTAGGLASAPPSRRTWPLVAV